MDNTWFIYYLLLMLIILYFPWKRRKRYAAKRIMKKGKDVYINLLDGRADGVIKEVTDNGIVLENKNGVQVVNLDYVIKLREYPHNKKGKRSTIMDM